MKNDLIALAIISGILIIMIFIMTPMDKITIKNFSGLLGILGYFVVKKIVDVYFAKKG
jgi:hypothetical protein